MNASKALIAAALIALSACTSSVKTSTDGKTTTVTSDHGSVTVGKDVDTSKLGAPVYPGATSDSDGGVSLSGQSGSATMASFKTTDDFDKVYQFYKSQMPAGSEKMKMGSGDDQAAMFVIGDAKAGDDQKGDATTVQITGKTGETDIIITHKSGTP